MEALGGRVGGRRAVSGERRADARARRGGGFFFPARFVVQGFRITVVAQTLPVNGMQSLKHIGVPLFSGGVGPASLPAAALLGPVLLALGAV